MYDEILHEMRLAVKAGRVRFTTHAFDELDNENLATDDAEHCIMTGEIVDNQYDPRYQNVKYVIYGDTMLGDEIGLIARWDNQDNIVVITVFGLKIDDYE
jgi:Domain of unknown function (DUF4258)